jgi:hypothetical protein
MGRRGEHGKYTTQQHLSETAPKDRFRSLRQPNMRSVYACLTDESDGCYTHGGRRTSLHAREHISAAYSPSNRAELRPSSPHLVVIIHHRVHAALPHRAQARIAAAVAVYALEVFGHAYKSCPTQRSNLSNHQ